MSRNDCSPDYQGGENFDLRQMLQRGQHLRLEEKTALFDAFVRELCEKGQLLWMRRITSAPDRVVRVLDPLTGGEREMIMFGSNNYLGLAGHPIVRARAAEALRRYGAGIGGPPLLNGYTALHRLLEERLATLKGADDAMIFSSGYGANVGIVTGLLNGSDIVLYDGYSHASFCDGIRMANVQSFHFPHNNVSRLRALLDRFPEPRAHDLYVGVEGVYSMDGDLAPLDRIVPMCRARGAILILDDAHGTGVLGPHGHGTAEHFGLDGQVDISMGTFSKTFAVTGGFVAAPTPVINYLRYFARSYMFSASLPPVVIATVLAGLDVMESEPELLVRLWENIRYATAQLRAIGLDVRPDAAIIPLLVPLGMDIRSAARRFHERGIFVNSVEYPAVPVSQQRFRISLMATHTKEDIDRLVETVAEVWGTEYAAAPRIAA